MYPKIKEFKNGAYTVFEPANHGFYIVKLVNSRGNLEEKMTCDTYQGAREYWRIFNKIAKGLKND